MPDRLERAPTLQTARLELRAHRADDLDACARLWADPLVTQYTTGRPLARQEVWTRLLRHPGHWALLGFGYWLAFERASGQFVGELGVARFERDVMRARPDVAGLPEAGWVLSPPAHGKGYAHEAMTAVLAWRDEHVPGPGTFCLIHPDNAPSLRLAAKLGFSAQGEVGEPDARLLLLTR